MKAGDNITIKIKLLSNCHLKIKHSPSPFLLPPAQPVISQFSAAVFSPDTAASLLLPMYTAIVHFVESGQY